MYILESEHLNHSREVMLGFKHRWYYHNVADKRHTKSWLVLEKDILISAGELDVINRHKKAHSFKRLAVVKARSPWQTWTYSWQQGFYDYLDSDEVTPQISFSIRISRYKNIWLTAITSEVPMSISCVYSTWCFTSIFLDLCMRLGLFCWV